MFTTLVGCCQSPAQMHQQQLCLCTCSMAKKRFNLVPASMVIFTLLTWWFIFSFSTRNLQWRSNAGTCDVSVGTWEYEPSPPLYTNTSCRYIHPSQNCFKNGRPDRDYLNWKWKPHDCELPWLDPVVFLDTMRDKQMVFIGDSLARNHMQSLLCLLTNVEEPEKIYHDNVTLEIRWRFPTYNFVLADMWSPFLVEFTVDEDGTHKLHLDVPESDWASKLHMYDVAVVSSGYWYFRPCIYYVGNRLLGNNSYVAFGMRAAYRVAHERVLRFMREEFRGITVLRTITVDHFENGSWDSGGFCNRTRPVLDGSLDVPWMNSKMREVQVAEFVRATRYRKNTRMKLLDVTLSASMRPDAHPGVYRMPDLASNNDCLHWCMPGAVDTWNQLLFHILYA